MILQEHFYLTAQGFDSQYAIYAKFVDEILDIAVDRRGLVDSEGLVMLDEFGTEKFVYARISTQPPPNLPGDEIAAGSRRRQHPIYHCQYSLTRGQHDGDARKCVSWLGKYSFFLVGYRSGRTGRGR